MRILLGAEIIFEANRMAKEIHPKTKSSRLLNFPN